MGFLTGNESLRRRPPGRRAIWAEASAALLFQSPGPAPSLFWTQVSCDCFPDDCRDGPIRGPVLFPAQRLFEQEPANVGRKSHGDLLKVAALSVRPVNLHGLCDLLRTPARSWFSDYLLSGFRITCFLVNRLRRRLRRGAFCWFQHHLCNLSHARPFAHSCLTMRSIAFA